MSGEPSLSPTSPTDRPARDAVRPRAALRRFGLRAVAALVLGLPVLLGLVPAGAVASAAADAAAADAGVVARDDVAMAIQRDGSAKVTETVVYDFGPAGAGGFTRTIGTRVRYDDRNDRLYRVHDVEVASKGAPAKFTVNAGQGATAIDVQAGAGVKGRHRYTISYVVDGMVAPAVGGQQVTWAVVGGWTVPVRKSSVRLVAPAQVQHVSCTAGAPGSAVPCSLAQTGAGGNQEPVNGAGATFLQNDLPANGALVIDVGLPAGTVRAQPILELRHTLATAFSVTPFTLAALIGLVVLAIVGLWLLWRLRGRDARAVAAERDTGGRRPFHDADGEVVFSPPGGLRPGQVGTLVDEQADVVDVVATLLDLAIRNYVFIEELSGSRPDWRLHKRNEPGDELLPYERAVYDELFEDGDTVLVSDLRTVLAGDMHRLRDLMYRDVVAQGWFANRPDRVRSRWLVGGVAVAVLGVLATVLLALFTFDGLVGLAIVVAGIGVAVAAEYMPARTARGSQVLAQINGLRQYVQGADPADVPDELQEVLCARLIPYAAVFGAEDRWAHAVSRSVDVGDEGISWFAGADGWRREDLDDSVSNFLVEVTGAVSTARPFARLG